MISSAILSERVTDQCMNLSSVLLSQYDFTDLAHPWQEYWCPFENFRTRFDDILAKALVELAALARVTLDVDSKFGSKMVVGELTQDGKKMELSFREACNKIIHAVTLKIDLAFSDRHPLDNGKNGYSDSQIKRFKNPIIRTEGEYKKKVWKANIYFFKYIKVLKWKFA